MGKGGGRKERDGDGETGGGEGELERGQNWLAYPIYYLYNLEFVYMQHEVTNKVRHQHSISIL